MRPALPCKVFDDEIAKSDINLKNMYKTSSQRPVLADTGTVGIIDMETVIL